MWMKALRIVCLTVLLLSPSLAVGASPASWQLASWQRPEQDRARREVLEGKILSYAEIARLARRAVPGRIVGQDLERRGRDRYVYRLAIMQKGGKVASVTIDAHSGRILSVRGKR